MVKKLKDDNEREPEEKEPSIKELLNIVLRNQKDINDRLDDNEKKNIAQEKALLQMVNFLYDTDDKHIPELTRIPVQAARPFALGMGLETILDPAYADIPLSKTVRLHYMRLMRSVGGVHLGRGLRLAEDQAQAMSDSLEEGDLGGD